jgi:sporulation protein YlmC with PRC-barrel domain
MKKEALPVPTFETSGIQASKGSAFAHVTDVKVRTNESKAAKILFIPMDKRLVQLIKFRLGAG